ncbi:MAG: hypothetical protein IJ170_11150 [Ruminococcus sp.]|nr:hypothetical protein [Ruminococcus sp.]
MKRTIIILTIIAIALVCLVSCGTNSFDGKWECVNATVTTYGNVELEKAYQELARSGCLSLLCEIKIDGDKVSYEENMCSYTVSNVKHNADSISFTVKDGRKISSHVSLKLADNGNSIIATRDMNTYTLERSDLIHKIILKIPIWMYLLLGLLLAFIYVGRTVKKKDRSAFRGFR